MNRLDLIFEESPWELLCGSLKAGDSLSAVRFLTLMEGEDEETVEDALLRLEEKHITLDVAELPKSYGTGEGAVRLRREEQLAGQHNYYQKLESNDPLRLYLEELAGIPAQADAGLLAAECAAGKESSREKLLNLRLFRVAEIAGEFTGRGVLLLDLIQEGSLGLWQAIAGYTGGDFESYSDWHIRQAMAKAVTLQARSSGVGQKMRQALEDYRAVDERLLGELGRNATLEEIAEELHMSGEEAAMVKNMLESARLMNRAKTEPEPEENDGEEARHVEDTALFQMRQRILDLLSGLEEQDAQLLTLRFGLEGGRPLSPAETGKKLGLTPEEVVAKEAAALAQLRGN